MRPTTSASFEALGLPPEAARRLTRQVNEAVRRTRAGRPSQRDVRRWLAFLRILDRNPASWKSFPIYQELYRLAYEGRRTADGPGPAWVPSRDAIRRTNLSDLQRERGVRTYDALHGWSVDHRDEFWSTMLRRLGIVFRDPPARMRAPESEPRRPDWLPGARLNIAESCFGADPSKTAILSASESAPQLRHISYGELRRLAGRVANGLDDLGTSKGDRIALYLPMSPESVAIYLGVILAGRCVVGVADASAPADFANRSRISGSKLVFTVDGYRRDGRDHRIYEKVVAGKGPRAVVLASAEGARAAVARTEDLAWGEFLSAREAYEAIPCRPSDPTNILFSSGTTKDPKAIPWTHTTPIKAAADAHLHLDVHADDVLAWPTSFGWMMGPWLAYSSLINRATMALYVGSPAQRAFGEWVAEAGVTMLGVVPKLVRTWRAERIMEGLDWSRITRFSSTAEPSTPEEMLYLMWLAGGKPVVEYCGGTEVGGAYITGTMVQPCSPSTFTTPTLGLDFRILDGGRLADRGEVFLVPPSIGLSNDLLNYDHDAEYYAGVPQGPDGEILRRHGDQIEQLGGGFYRHHGRIDDMINLNGVKTSAEEIRSVIGHEAVYDAKPFAVDLEGTGQHVLVVYAVPKDPHGLESEDLRARLKRDYRTAIKERLNPLLANVHDVVLVPELPQAGPGKTRTTPGLRRDYEARRARP